MLGLCVKLGIPCQKWRAYVVMKVIQQRGLFKTLLNDWSGAFFAKVINGFQPLTVFEKRHHLIYLTGFQIWLYSSTKLPTYLLIQIQLCKFNKMVDKIKQVCIIMLCLRFEIISESFKLRKKFKLRHRNVNYPLNSLFFQTSMVWA